MRQSCRTNVTYVLGIIFFVLFLSGCAYMDFDGLENLNTKEVISFAFDNSTNTSLKSQIAGYINSNTIMIEVPYGTDLTSLVPDISFKGSAITPSIGSAGDFSSPVIYTVTAANGSTTSYKVHVSVDMESKNISSFSFKDASNPNLSSDINGEINSTAGTVKLTVPFGTDVTSLVPDIIFTGKTVSPASNTPVNFTNPVDYSVTAGNNTVKTYTVTVEETLNTAKEITSFTFTAALNGSLNNDVTAAIDNNTGEISVTVPFGTTLTALIPSIVISGDTISPLSNSVQDFSDSVNSPVEYTVTAANGFTRIYAVSVTAAPNTAKAITGFTFTAALNGSLAADISGVIDELAGTISVHVPFNTPLTALVPSYSTTGSSVNLANNTARDFTGSVDYIVTADDLSTKTYTVTVTVDNNTDNTISSFDFFDGDNIDLFADETADINHIDRTIDFYMPTGTFLNALVPAIVLPPQATISPQSGVARDFSNGPVTYTVTAGNGSVKTYAVNVIVNNNVALQSIVNDKYIRCDFVNDGRLRANGNTIASWEMFTVVLNYGDKTVSLLNWAGEQRYVCIDFNTDTTLKPTASSIGSWEKFYLIHNGDGTISLQSKVNSKYVSCDFNSDSRLQADDDSIASWEKFRFIPF